MRIQIKDNPDSALTQGPQPTFSSRYADPAHPSNEGSLVAVVSRGNVTRDQLLPGRAARRARREERPRRLGSLRPLASSVHSGTSDPAQEGHRESFGPRQLRSKFGIVSGIKKFTTVSLFDSPFDKQG